MTQRTETTTELDRRLSLTDCVMVGLGSMIGAGVFVVYSPTAAVSGNGLLIGLVIAAIVAYCNASASAQLASQYPTSGGTYVFGREQLNATAGFVAGWGFVIGKTASCTAMALTFATYAAPDDPERRRWIAMAAVAALAALNYRGVSRTAQMTRILVGFTLISLTVAMVGLWSSGMFDLERITGSAGWEKTSPFSVLQSAGLIFFAFAGYARIATMGEEVRDPQTTIPRAIPIALCIAMSVYAIIGFTILGIAGQEAIAASGAPMVATAEIANREWLLPLIRVAAAVASLGALLGLMAGIGRTSLAMARNGDLPRILAAVHPRFRVPHVAEVVLAIIVMALLLVADIRSAIGFSSFGVLVYYAIANLSAWTQGDSHRRYPRWVFIAGLLGCITLTVVLPRQSIVIGVIVYVVGLSLRWLAIRSRREG